jgi:hypothetical protein
MTYQTPALILVGAAQGLVLGNQPDLPIPDSQSCGGDVGSRNVHC